jgi:hypothetical protein
MALIYKKPPPTLLNKPWNEKNLLKETYKMQNKDTCFKMKAEIHIDNGKLGVKFIVDKTISNFNNGAKKIHLNWTTSFKEFENVLEGQYKTSRKQVIHDHFIPEPVNPAMVSLKQDCLKEENFCCAIELFLKKALHNKKPWDCLYIYLAPGGNYNVRKVFVTKPLNHLY